MREREREREYVLVCIREKLPKVKLPLQKRNLFPTFTHTFSNMVKEMMLDFKCLPGYHSPNED